MKSALRQVLVNFSCFWLISLLISAIDYSQKIEVLLFASITLSIVNFLIKPILSLLFLPINLITLGTFRWVVNALVLFFVTLLVPGFHLVAFVFPGANFAGFVVPTIRVNTFLAIILVSFLLSLFSDMIYSLFK